MKTPPPRLRPVFFALLGGILLVPVPRARADFFSDRAAFNASAPPLTIQTFENLVGTPQYPSANPPDNSVSYTYSPQGLTISGVRMVGSGDFGTETYIVTPSFGSGVYAVDGSGSMILGRHFSDFYLPAGVNAFGVDYCLDRYWLGPNPIGTLMVTVEMADGFTQTATISVVGAARFLGFTDPTNSHGGISHLRLDSGGLGLYPYTLVDNMTFNLSAVPEPATWWAGAGLALGLGGIVWRRAGVRRQCIPA